LTRTKLFSLVITAVIVAAAIIGTQSASPTALCESEAKGGACGIESKYFQGEEGSATIETSVGNISCTAPYIEGETSEAATAKGVALKGKLWAMEFFGCTLAGKKCTAKPSVPSYPVLYKWLSASNGELEFTAGSLPKVTLTCEGSIECTYSFESPLEIKGGSAGAASIVASKEVLGSASGKLCPKSGASLVWSGTFKLSQARFVADELTPVKLCKANETPCSAENTYASSSPIVAGLEAGTRANFSLSITEESEATEYTVSCETSTLEGSSGLAKWPMLGSISSLKFGRCGGTCAIKALKLGYTAEIEASGGGNGTLAMKAGGGGEPPRLRVRCIGAYKCTYESTSISTSVTGGAPAKLAVTVIVSKLVTGESDAKCGSQVTWEGTYVLTKPEGTGGSKMWVTRTGV
jgi:hypothetical protein